MSEKRPEDPTEKPAPAPDKLIPFLTAPRLAVRLGHLAAVGGLFFLLSWYISYLFLPEGAFNSPASEGGGSGWLSALAAQAPLAAAILLGNMLLRVKGLPLGYLAAAWAYIRYGLVAGTNSFLVPYSQRIPPTFRIFSRGGVYAMIAWALLAAASCSWAFLEMEKASDGIRRVRVGPVISLPEALAAGAGVLILVLAAVLTAAGVLAA